jgi:hypothetical protein
MPRFSATGFAPAVTFLRPSSKIASAKTVAVVVDSAAYLRRRSLRLCLRLAWWSMDDGYAGVTLLFLEVLGDPQQVVIEGLGVGQSPSADLLDDLIISLVRHS